MELWPEEYEGLRDEARATAVAMAERMQSLKTDVPTTRDEQVARIRQMASASETASPDGVDAQFAGVACRVFRPQGSARAVYLHLHGSGMIAASPLMDDAANAALAARLGIAVVSVDYRLAPEHPYPAGADDCVAVGGWLLDHAETEFGTSRLVVGGESAGAYYAVVTLLRLRDERGSVDQFVGASLSFGVYDLSGTPSARGAGPSDLPGVVDGSRRDLIRECYLPGLTPEEIRAPEISPLYAQLRGLPPAIFTVGSADRLLDDSMFMAARWASFGNEVELAVYPDGIHSFVRHPIELAKRANGRIDEFLDRVLV